MKMKKALAALMAVVISSMLLTACGNTEDSVNESKEDNNSQISQNNSTDESDDIDKEKIEKGVKVLASPKEVTGKFKQVSDTLSASLLDFSKNSVSIALGVDDLEGKNRCFSPLSVYYALAMLSETADNNTREEILSALCYDSDSLGDDLSDLTERLIAFNHEDQKTVVRNSLWLSELWEFNVETCQKLGELYQAQVSTVDFTSDVSEMAVAQWISDGCEGFLQPSPEAFDFDIDTLAVIVNTLYYNGSWSDMLSQPYDATFTAQSGEEMNTKFMNGYFETGYVYDDFVATNIPLSDGAKFTVILPDEGITPQELLDEKSEDVFECITGYDRIGQYDVTLKIPQFDISTSFSLNENLKALGINDAFEPALSDFTPLSTDAEDIYVSDVIQETRFSIDEEGCTGAAYTMIAMDNATAIKPVEREKLEINCNRPFIFALSRENAVMFVGVIESTD